jgi:hypothetical protein
VSAPPAPAPVGAAPTPRSVGGSWNRTIWLIGGALILVVASISTVALASELSQPTPPPASAGVSTGNLTPAQIAARLKGRTFTRDVTPPELASAAPLRDVYVQGTVPGLVGELSTSTTDLGTTVTYYVFSDPAWALAFFQAPPIPYGCGICSSMGGGTAVEGVGDQAATYVLYKKTTGGDTWIATTTYALNGNVVIDALHVPVSNASATPPATDMAAPASCIRPALQILGSVKG